jgi:hypothetical protein
VIQTSQTESAYYGKFAEKRLDELLKKWDSQPKTEVNRSQRLLEVEQVFIEALKDCVNNLDSRLRILESKQAV